MQFNIGHWSVDTQTNEIVSGDERRMLESLTMNVLGVLYRRHGEVVSRDELIEAAWPRQVVSDHAVTVVISTLRNALGDNSRDPHYIQTVPKRGYRLLVNSESANPAAGEGAGKSTRWPAVAAACAIAATFLLVALFILSDRPATGGLVVANAVNTTRNQEFDSLAAAATAATVDFLTRYSDIPVIRSRSSDLSVQSSAHLYLETSIIETPDGMLLSMVLSETDSQRVTWTSGVPISVDLFSHGHRRLLGDVAKHLEIDDGHYVSLHTEDLVEDLYWKARLFWEQRTADTARQAQALLQEAIAKKPGFARGHAALADLYAYKTGEFFLDEYPDPIAQAQIHVDAALALAPELYEARLAKAHVELFGYGNSAAALKTFEKLLKEKPSHPIAIKSFAIANVAAGNFNRAVTAMQKAASLDPFNVATVWDNVWLLYVVQRHEEALLAIDAAERLGGNGDFYRGLILADMNEHRAALDAFDRLWLKKISDVGPLANGMTAEEGDITGRYERLLTQLESAPKGSRATIVYATIASLAGKLRQAKNAISGGDQQTRIWMQLWAERVPALAPLYSNGPPD